MTVLIPLSCWNFMKSSSMMRASTVPREDNRSPRDPLLCSASWIVSCILVSSSSTSYSGPRNHCKAFLAISFLQNIFRTWLTVTQTTGRASVFSARSRHMPLVLRLYELSPSEPHSLNFGRLFPSMSWVLWSETLNTKNENSGFERKRSSEK